MLDLCTGCGNRAIAMALQAPQAGAYATDLGAAALAVVARNLERYGLSARVQLRQGDLFGALRAPGDAGADAGLRFSLIACNPPYLATRHATQ